MVTLREADGSIAGGFKCRILDATSRPVPCTFVKRGTASASLGSSPSSDGPSDVCPALAPGMYQFEYSTTVQKQNVRATQPFEIVAGKVTDLTIHVAPR